MDPSVTPKIASVEAQSKAWDHWNSVARTDRLPESSRRQGLIVEATVQAMGRRDLKIIDVGCGTGWMCERLTAYGEVTGTDFISSTLEKARARVPTVRFIEGDIFKLDLPNGHFDAAISLEVLSHVADQSQFIRRLADLLRPGGSLVLATQNRPIYERWSSVAPPAPDRIRKWVNAGELKQLLEPHFRSIRMTSVGPEGNLGYLRLVNSVKINQLLQKLVPARWIEAAKERAMLGSTLVVVASKR
jgi:2-polyprenyl-3-methyl-5-hydroxy-6-metoxy-1,4-benzoquinol methylase